MPQPRMHPLRLIAVALLAIGILSAGDAFAKAGAGGHGGGPHNLPLPGANARTYVTADGGHLIGNLDARLKLVEYMSYTCPHCAAFENEGGMPIRLALVPGGHLSYEVRHLVRDPIDMAVALLTNCGAPSRFFLLHQAFLHDQPNWLQAAGAMTDAQQARWNNGDMPSRMRAIASDLHFYEFMESHGYDRIAVDHCLSDQAMAHRLAAQTEEASKLGINGTPGFTLNGAVLIGTYSWATLEPQLKARL